LGLGETAFSSCNGKNADEKGGREEVSDELRLRKRRKETRREESTNSNGSSGLGDGGNLAIGRRQGGTEPKVNE